MFTHEMTENTIPILFPLSISLSLALCLPLSLVSSLCIIYERNGCLEALIIDPGRLDPLGHERKMAEGAGGLLGFYAVYSSLLISPALFLSNTHTHTGSPCPCCSAVVTKWSRRTWRKKRSCSSLPVHHSRLAFPHRLWGDRKQGKKQTKRKNLNRRQWQCC